MDTDDLPPVLEPIQVDFSRMVGVAAPGGMEVGLEPAPEPEPEAKPEAPRQATEEAVGQRQLEPLVSGSVTAEDSPLPGQSGLTFDQMVERALSESGGSPFGGHLQAQRPPSGQTSENVRSPVILGDETQPNTPQSCDVDKEMQEFIGLEERLRRGDELTEEEQLLCRTPSAVSARNAVAANVSSKESSRVQPPDTQIDAALVWAGLDADSPPDRDHPTAADMARNAMENVASLARNLASSHVQHLVSQSIPAGTSVVGKFCVAEEYATRNSDAGDAFDDASSWHDDEREYEDDDDDEGEEQEEETYGSMASNERHDSDGCTQHQHQQQPHYRNDRASRIAGTVASQALQPDEKVTPNGLSDAAVDALPPTSALVTRVFGAARAQISMPSDATPKHGHARGHAANRRSRGNGKPDPDRVCKMREQEAILQAQVERLEMEEKKITRDRAALTQQRVALERREDAFKQRQDEALLKIEEERREFDEYKADEIRKMKRDRRNQERNVVRGAAQAANEKRLREDLQAQVEALQTAAQAKEARARLLEGRLRSQIDELKKRNAELEGDLAFHEQQRLTRWKAEEVEVSRPSAGRPDQGPSQGGTVDGVLKGIDTRLRNSMVRSRGIVEDLSRQTWDTTAGTSRADSSSGDGPLVIDEQLCSTGKDADSHQQQQNQKQKQQQPMHPPTLSDDNSRLSSASNEAGEDSNETSKPRCSSSALVASAPRSDPRSDPQVQGRTQRSHDINQHLSTRTHATNPPGKGSTVEDTGQVIRENDDAATIQREWSFLIKTMPSLTPIAAIKPRPPALIFEEHHPDGKHEQAYMGGCRCIAFPNGTRKEIRAADVAGGTREDNCEQTETIYFSNGDIKQVSGGLTRYFFHSTGTTQVTLPNGDNLFSFESGQKERHYSDGTRRIAFPNGTVRWLSPENLVNSQ